MNTSTRDQSRERNPVRSSGSVGENDDLEPILDSPLSFRSNSLESSSVARKSLRFGEGDVDELGLPSSLSEVDVLESVDLLDGENGRRENDSVALLGSDVEEVSFGSDVLRKHEVGEEISEDTRGTKRKERRLTDSSDMTIDSRIGSIGGLVT